MVCFKPNYTPWCSLLLQDVSTFGGVVEVDVLDAYIHSLKQFRAIAPCDNFLRSLVVQDFDKRNQSLKVVNSFNCKCVAEIVVSSISLL